MDTVDNRGRLTKLATEVYIRRSTSTATFRIHCSSDGGAALVSRDGGQTFDAEVEPGNSMDLSGTAFKVKPKEPARGCSIIYERIEEK